MIRVLRLMEYEYPDHAAMERDMGNWYVPAIGSQNIGQPGGTIRVIRSTVLAYPMFDEED